MRTIIIRAPAADLSAEMAAMPAMRKWLDEQASEPARFTSRRNGDVITVCVEFNKIAAVKRSKHTSIVDTAGGWSLRPGTEWPTSWGGQQRTRTNALGDAAVRAQ